MAMLAVYHDPVGGNPHQPKLNSPPEIYVARLPANGDDDVIEADPLEEFSVPPPSASRARVIHYPDAVFLDDERCAQPGSAPNHRYRAVAGGGDLPPVGGPSDDEEADNLQEPFLDRPMYGHVRVGVFEDVFGGLHLRCYLSRRARRFTLMGMGFAMVIATGKLSEVAELVAKILF